MSTLIEALIPSKQAEGAQTTQYTSLGVRTIIDKFTVTNTTVGAVTFAANLVTTGGAAGAANLIVRRSISPGQTYTCPELVGHILEEGNFISTLAGAAASLTIRASGRQVTATS